MLLDVPLSKRGWNQPGLSQPGRQPALANCCKLLQLLLNLNFQVQDSNTKKGNFMQLAWTVETLTLCIRPFHIGMVHSFHQKFTRGKRQEHQHSKAHFAVCTPGSSASQLSQVLVLNPFWTSACIIDSWTLATQVPYISLMRNRYVCASRIYAKTYFPVLQLYNIYIYTKF